MMVPPDTYSSREIMHTGHTFFGSVSKGLANVVEYAFKNQGRPNGYILGQEASGAFVAGLRYGEGVLYTRDAGTHRVYWQGPSIGYDAGAEGSKVMMLVYNLRDPGDMYQRFGGVDGSAYFVGGVGVTFQKSGEIVVAPIRSGVGLRLGANVGYLKYTPGQPGTRSSPAGRRGRCCRLGVTAGRSAPSIGTQSPSVLAGLKVGSSCGSCA